MSRPSVDPPRPSPLYEVVRELRHPFDLASVLSLGVLILGPGRIGPVGTVVTALLASSIVVVPRIRRSPWPWLVLAALHGASYVDGWYRLDNHDLLAAWWALAVAVAAGTRGVERDVALARQARWILGTVFGLAAVWKIASGQFLDGSFFTHALLLDQRFQGATSLLTSLSVEQLSEVRGAVWSAATGPQGAALQLAGAAEVLWPARMFSAWGVIIEAAVAVGMLGPDRPAWKRFRQVALILFLLTTYIVVPVVRFAILLGAVGVAQSLDDRTWRWVFVAVTGIIVLWAPIWVYLLAAAN